MNGPKPTGAPRSAGAPDETPETLAVAAFLRAHDPALAFPAGLDEARRRRLLRHMRHPRIALLLLHHRTASLAGAFAAVVLVALALLWLVRAPRNDPVLSIRIRPAPVQAPPAPLDQPPPEADPTDEAQPLPFSDPALDEPVSGDPDSGEPDSDEPDSGEPSSDEPGRV